MNCTTCESEICDTCLNCECDGGCVCGLGGETVWDALPDELNPHA